MRRASWRLLASTILASATSVAAAPEPAAPSPERIRSAAEEFDRGRRAFLAKDFEQAAVHFENAYRDAPRAESLRLAIRARREAKQPARAATHAAVALERYGDDAPTAQLAKEVLAESSPQLHDLTVECSPECSLAEGGRILSQSDGPRHHVFLEPGTHEIAVGFRQGTVSLTVDATRGGKDVLPVAAPPEPPDPAAAAPPPGAGLPGPSPVRPPEAARGNKPFGPVVFFVAAGITLVAGGATVASGLDTQNNPGIDAVRRECAGKDESCPLYREGQSSETRTNVLLGVTAGATVATAVLGVFFTRWSSPSVAIAPSVGPGHAGASLGGHF